MTRIKGKYGGRFRWVQGRLKLRHFKRCSTLRAAGAIVEFSKNVPIHA
jgi:hypothetical protein